MRGSRALLLLVAALAGVAPMGLAHAGDATPAARASDPTPADLTPVKERITDQAMARDRAAMDGLGRRIGAVDSTASLPRVYTRALALAWLTLARDQYALNDRSDLVDVAFEQASTLIGTLEARRAKLRYDFPVTTAAPKIRKDLWQLADSVKKTEALRCVVEDVARLEVALVRAGHETTVCRSEDPHPHALAAAAQATNVRRVAAECILPVAIAPAPVVPMPQPAPAAVPEVVRIALQRLGAFSNVHFDINADTISMASAVVLDSVASVLGSVPEIRATLIGHTDPRGSAAYNLALGQRRASAVRDYLVRRGVDGSRLSIASQGKTAPVALGSGSHEHALNRRVEIQYSTPIDRLTVRRQEGDLQIEKARKPKPKPVAAHRTTAGTRRRTAATAPKRATATVR